MSISLDMLKHKLYDQYKALAPEEQKRFRNEFYKYHGYWGRAFFSMIKEIDLHIEKGHIKRDND